MVATKDKYLTIRVTDGEKAMIQAGAERNECTMSDYLLRLVMEDEVRNGGKSLLRRQKK